MGALLARIKANHGFLTNEDVAEMVKTDPHRMILVRCGCGRFMAPAQNVLHFCEIIDREGTDYVRDLSLPTTDPIWK